MLPTEDLFVYVYVLVDDAIGARAIVIPARPGPAPSCSDAEPLAIALVRHLLGRRSGCRRADPGHPVDRVYAYHPAASGHAGQLRQEPL